MIEGFIPYAAEDVPPIFSYDDIGFVDDTNPLRFPITQIMVNADAFHIRAFYYITFLDEKTCQSLYPHATTNGALKTVVQEQAIKDLNDEYPKKLPLTTRIYFILLIK